ARVAPHRKRRADYGRIGPDRPDAGVHGAEARHAVAHLRGGSSAERSEKRGVWATPTGIYAKAGFARHDLSCSRAVSISSSLTDPRVPMRITRPESLLRDPAMTVPKRSYIRRTISFPRPSASSATTVCDRLSRANDRRPSASHPARSFVDNRSWRASTAG